MSEILLKNENMYENFGLLFEIIFNKSDQNTKTGDINYNKNN